MRAHRQQPRRTTPTAVWDRLSVRYDRQLWLERAAIKRLIDLAAPAGTDRVLDVATGTGAVLRILTTRDPPPRQVEGVDRSSSMLARAPSLPDGWQIKRADATALPYPDGSFDLVTASYILHVLDDNDRTAVLQEIRRVLRPGGRVAALTPTIPPRGPLRPIARVLDRLAIWAPDQLGGLRALDPRAALIATGFEVVAAQQSARGYISICVLAQQAPSPTPRT